MYKKLFHFKDRTDTDLQNDTEKDNIKEKHAQSLVVYRLTCETCKQTYIGKIERILSNRIKEHLTCLIQTTSKYLIEADDRGTSNFKIRLKEELHIITHKPELNSQHAAT